MNRCDLKLPIRLKRYVEYLWRRKKKKKALRLLWGVNEWSLQRPATAHWEALFIKPEIDR